LIIYPGHIPSNPNRDAKYSVVHAGGGMEVQLRYRVSSRELVLLTTDRHDALVDMVNEVKVAVSGVPGGVFYINEYRDVLVKANTECFYAGNYPYDLEFDFEGTVIGPRAPRTLRPGDVWEGPHVGIRHALTADGSDIKYVKKTGNREVTVFLSDDVDPESARNLAQRLGRNKGPQGGRVYINEALEFFTPIDRGAVTDYVYLGCLDEDPWFTAPDVPRPGD
jgi:hypothetical protein